MATIIGIRFKTSGKTYYFDAGEFTFARGDFAIVETAQGLECGEVVFPNRELAEEELNKPLKPVVRPATADDLKRVADNERKEQEAMRICAEKVAAHKLDMHLVRAEYAFDGSKILFYFTADGRVDFRNLVKDLASAFHTRIELRQIGVRDEAKMLGGLGICGQPLCCSRFLNDFQPVSIKMAKEQGLSLNPTKISGSCGRLMCCLKYEQEAYSSLIRITPKQGALVNTPEGRGTVTEVSLLTGMLKVRLEKAPDSPPVAMKRDDVKVIRDGKGAPAPVQEETEE
ncbi:MAG: stage 0 sporulation family protein [Clostridia bacterium]|nr:stage 0 sporulation family protein [Clostridia bacterium]